LPRRILDFPSGHGRALRYLRAGFPDATLYAGDINQSGLDFCKTQFSADIFLSEVDFSRVTLPANMDLILCGSLVTHLSEARAKQLIDLLCDALAPDGICLLSTHGRMYERYINGIAPIIDADNWSAIVQDYQKGGYGYRDYKEFAHIQYGISLIKPEWLFDHIHTRDDLTVLFFAEKAWHGQHDVAAIQKRDLSTWYDPAFL
jgi:SAM-dependent methyltransferase